MKTNTIDRNWHPDFENTPPVLLLRPESEDDQILLKTLIAKYKTAGFGRDPKTNEILHLTIELKRK